jgi:hypothetical protein
LNEQFTERSSALGRAYNVASPAEIVESHIRSGVHHEFPPAGTQVFSVGPGEYIVVGTPTSGSPGDWWITDTATLTEGRLLGDATKLAARILKLVSRSAAGGVAATLATWPWIWKWSEGEPMRWIKVTLRGTLAPTEQFQHGLALGVPGNDPTLNEVDAPAYAQTVATAWKAQFAGMADVFTPNVVYTEVGAVQMEQDDPTGSDGSGGNRRQSYPTGWWQWATADRPKGITNSASLPYEVATAVTLRTTTRGPRGRGRFYLPPPAIDVMDTGAGGLLKAVYVTEIGTQIGHFITAVEAATGHQVLVVSGRAKQLHQVSSIEVGRVPDSQRRRRKKLDEAPMTGWTR